MKKLLILAVLVGYLQAVTGWHQDTVYTYNINSKSLFSHNKQEHHFQGVIIKGTLQIQTVSESLGSLSGQIKNLQYAEVHSTSSNECSLTADEISNDWKEINFSNNIFGVILNNGVIKKLLLKENTLPEEANIIRAIITQLQIDLEGENKMASTNCSKSNRTNNSTMAFSTMEESITGHCETIYGISPLPENIIRSKPTLAPLLNDSPKLQNIIDVMKITNFNNCKQLIAYHKGMNGRKIWDGDHSDFGNVISRKAEARLIINGTFQNYTLHSSVRIDKMFITPSLYKSTKAVVWSCMNLTLVEMKKSNISVSVPKESETTLLYDYEYESATMIDSINDSFNINTGAVPANIHNKTRNSEYRDAFGFPNRYRRARDVATSSPSPLQNSTTYPLYTTTAYRTSTINITIPPILNQTELNLLQITTPNSYFENSTFEVSTFEIDTNSTISNANSSTSSNNVTSEEIQSSVENTTEFENETVLTSTPNTMNNKEDNKLTYISSVLQSLNVSESLQQPLLSSLFSIYPSMKNKSFLQSQELQLAIKVKSEKIADHILEFKSIISENVLNTFCDLTFLISNVNFEVLHNVSKTMHQSSLANKNGKNHSWAVFRDAVTQAGTGPALMLIKEWILTNKITENEAEDIIGQLSRTADIPNEQYIDAIFDMAKDPRIESRQSIHASILFTLTNIIRQTLVDGRDEKMPYPIHIFRSQIHNKNKLKFVYIPFLKKKLENAVLKNDHCKVHIYSRALGNVANPEILNIFKKYLKSNSSMTTFQKVLVVMSLDKIVDLYPAETQQFLYMIYINVQEHYEVRVAAVFQIMQTKPPYNILQKIAELTRFEPNNQVIAAVKSSIHSATQLTDPGDEEFKENAKSVIHLLNPKDFGMDYSYHAQQSNKLLKDGNLGFIQILSYIGSDNSIIPKGFFIDFERFLGGLSKGKENYGLMFSDIKKVNYILENVWKVLHKKDLVDQFSNEQEKEQFSQETIEQRSSTTNLSSQDSDNKHIKNTEDDQIQTESILLFHMANNDKFLTFGKNFSSSIQNWLQKKLKSLTTGYKFNYIKLFQRDNFFYAIPNAAGLITQITYRVPTIYHLKGKLKLNIFQTQKSTASLEGMFAKLSLAGRFNLGYALNKHTNIGLVTPFNGKQYNIGYQEQLLFNIPIKINTTVMSQNQKVKITTKFSSDAQNSLGFYSQYNSKIYQEHKHLSDIVKKAGASDMQIMKTITPKQIVKEFGGFHLNSSLPVSENEKFNLQNMQASLNFIVSLSEKLKVPNNMNIILSGDFLKEESSVTFQMLFATSNNYSTNENESRSDFSIRNHNSKQNPMKDRSNTLYAEWNVFLNEDKTPKYAANISCIWSQFTNITKFSFSLLEKTNKVKHSRHHFRPIISFTSNGTWGKVPLFNFTKAISNSPNSELTAVLHLGASIEPTAVIQCDLQRTSQRKKYLMQQSETKICEKDMQDGNLILPSCQLPMLYANYLDQHNCTLKIANLKEMTNIYNLILNTLQKSTKNLHFYFQNHSNPSNHISFLSQFAPNFQNVNISIMFPDFKANLKNIDIHSLMRPIAEIHPTHSVMDRAAKFLFGRHYNPMCVLDKTKINTFDNQTYTISLGNCWHVLMALTFQNAANPKLNENDILILARDTKEGRDMRILIGDDVIDITTQEMQKHSSYKNIYVNNKQYRLSNYIFTSIALNNQNNNAIFYGRVIDENINLQFFTPNILISFDGVRIMLITTNIYRNQTLGLCGNFNGEESDEFNLPTSCNIEDPRQFIVSYAIFNNNSCSEEAINSIKDDLNESCSLTRDIFTNVNSPSCLNDTNREPDPRCMARYVQVQQDHKYTCFSKQFLSKCKASCQPIKLVKKNASFHCIGTSLISKYFVAKVKAGHLPDFGGKNTTKHLTVDIPTGCYTC